METKGADVIARFRSMAEDRGNWEALWREAAQLVLTRKSNIGNYISPGTNRDVQVFDSTAVRAAEKLASGLFGYLCPPNEEWFKLRTNRPELSRDEEVSRYFDTVTRIIREALYMSNFVLEIHEDFIDLGVFGTSNLYLSEGTVTPLSFRAVHIGEYYIDENADGEIDVVFRCFTMTARQMAQKFGMEELPEQVTKCLDGGKAEGLNRKFTVIHAVFPRSDRNPGLMRSDEMPFASVYVELTSQKVIRESGYVENPYSVCRFTKASDEKWGRASGTTSLPEVKLINKMKKTILFAAEKMVDPPILVPDDGVIGPFRTTPGALNYWRANAFQNKPEPWTFEGNLPIGLEMMNIEKKEIESAFYNDLFDILMDRQNMTATEVIQRAKDKLILIAPAIGRIQGEKLSKVIHRSFRILGELGLLPPPPMALMEAPTYEVMYISKLAMAIKMLDINATTDTLSMVLPLAQTNPEIMDNFNFDEIVRGTAYRNGMPPEFINNLETVAGIRQSRAEQIQQQQMMEAAQPVAGAVQALGKDVGPNSPLAAMAQGAAA